MVRGTGKVTCAPLRSPQIQEKPVVFGAADDATMNVLGDSPHPRVIRRELSMSTPIQRQRTVPARLWAGLVCVSSFVAFAILLGGSLPAQAQGKKPAAVDKEQDKQPKKDLPVE